MGFGLTSSSELCLAPGFYPKKIKKSSNSCSHSRRNIHSQVFLSPKAFRLKGYDSKLAKPHKKKKDGLWIMLNVTGAGWKRNDAKNKKRKSTGIFPLMRLCSGPPRLAARRSVAHQRLKSNERRRHGSAATRLWVHRLSARKECGNLLPRLLHGLNIYIRANDWACFLSLWHIWLRVSEAGKYFGSVRTILFSCGRYS